MLAAATRAENLNSKSYPDDGRLPVRTVLNPVTSSEPDSKPDMIVGTNHLRKYLNASEKNAHARKSRPSKISFEMFGIWGIFSTKSNRSMPFSTLR